MGVKMMEFGIALFVLGTIGNASVARQLRPHRTDVDPWDDEPLFVGLWRTLDARNYGDEGRTLLRIHQGATILQVVAAVVMLATIL